MIEIPKFLIEMSKQLNSQNNRSTAEPIYQVRFDKPITCADGREDFWCIVDTANEYHEIYRSDDCDLDYFFSYMREHYTDWVNEWEDTEEEEFNSDNFDVEDSYWDLPDGYEELEKIPMQNVREVVKSCLTESDAQAFIDRKQHDYRKLYIYVESMTFCPQMIELRNWIKSLTN